MQKLRAQSDLILTNPQRFIATRAFLSNQRITDLVPLFFLLTWMYFFPGCCRLALCVNLELGKIIVPAEAPTCAQVSVDFCMNETWLQKNSWNEGRLKKSAEEQSCFRTLDRSRGINLFCSQVSESFKSKFKFYFECIQTCLIYYLSQGSSF